MDYLDIVRFDAGLKVGDPVTVNWTNSGRDYSGDGIVVKINAMSTRVKLTEDVPSLIGGSGYPKGFVVTVPRPLNPRRWSQYNTVRPRAGHARTRRHAGGLGAAARRRG